MRCAFGPASTLTRGRKSAFTLVEILGVVVILGIAAAIIAPNLGNYDDQTVASAARLVMADLIYAQNRAIATQLTHYVQFTNTGTSTGSYSLTTALPPASNSDYVRHPVNLNNYVEQFGPGGTQGLQNVTLSSALFNGSTPVVAFDAMGSPWAYPATGGAGTALTSGTIQLTCGTQSLWITIEPLTGEILVANTAPQ